MATLADHSPMHSPPGHDTKRPRGILKNSYQKSPPTSPQRERSMSNKEVTIANTQINSGNPRSSSGARMPGSRRHSAQNSEDISEETSQRLKWDEANLYLAEQERGTNMKIDEPKTPYAKHYDPAEDPSDEEEEGQGLSAGGAGAAHQSTRARPEDDIPGFSLGEPEEEVPQAEEDEAEASAASRGGRGRSGSGGGEKSVHVASESIRAAAESEALGMSQEEREKHRQFEEARKKHYEMKNVAQLLGHPEALPDDEEDEDEDGVPPVPTLPHGVNGSA